MKHKLIVIVAAIVSIAVIAFAARWAPLVISIFRKLKELLAHCTWQMLKGHIKETVMAHRDSHGAAAKRALTKPLKPRHPLLPPVNQFTDAVNPILSHLRVYCDSERDAVQHCASNMVERAYDYYMVKLRKLSPRATSALAKKQQYNDSVHFLRVTYMRTTQRIKDNKWLVR